MTTGSLGNIVFTVSDEQVKTFNDFNLQGQANISTHARHNAKALPEFVGLNNDKVTLTVRVSRDLGAEPQEEINKLKENMNLGRLCTLTIGKTVHDYKWLISQIDISAENYDRYGTLSDITIRITLIEYPRS